MNNTWLSDLMQRSGAAVARMGRANPHRVLVMDLARAVAGLANIAVDQKKQIADQKQQIDADEQAALERTIREDAL